MAGRQVAMMPTLQQLAVSTLIRYKHCLGDVGTVPIELLEDVLALCTADELAEIEDGTREGSGRELLPWLWPFWREAVVAKFGPPPPEERLPPLPAAAEVAAGPAGVPPADYRALYERRLVELERKRAESGARLRALREQEEQQRAARHVMVVDPLPQRKRPRSTAASPAAVPRARGASNPHRQLLQPLGGQGSAKERLLKKLGLGRVAGSGGSGGGRSGQQPAGRHTVIICPAAVCPPAPRGACIGAGAGAGVGAVSGASAWLARRQQLEAAPPAGAERQVPGSSPDSAARVLGTLGTPPAGSPASCRDSYDSQQVPQLRPHGRPLQPPAAAAAHKQPSSPLSRGPWAQIGGVSGGGNADADKLFIPKKQRPAHHHQPQSQPQQQVRQVQQYGHRAQQCVQQVQLHAQQQQQQQQKQPARHDQQQQAGSMACCMSAPSPAPAPAPRQRPSSELLPRQQRRVQGAAAAAAAAAALRPPALEECDIFVEAEVLPPPKQLRLQGAAPAAAVTGPPSALEECDIFAEAEQQQQQQWRYRQQQYEASPAQQPAGQKRSARAAPPSAHKKLRQQQQQQRTEQAAWVGRPAALLQEVDLFDGL